MLLVAANTFFHYVLHSIDLRSEDPWENKTIYMRYVDIGVGERSGENLCYTVESFLKRALCCDLFWSDLLHRVLFCVCQVLFCVHLLCQVFVLCVFTVSGFVLCASTVSGFVLYDLLRQVLQSCVCI